MILSELIHRIKHLYSKGVPTDDSRLNNRHIYNKLVSVRSRLITQEANKRKKISKWNYKVLPCVELIEVPPHECDCLPYKGCKVLRSKYKIPKPLTTYTKHYLSKVSSIDGTIEYYEKEPHLLKYVKGSKYGKDRSYYYIRNEYLYTTNINGPQVLMIEGIFEDPVEVEKFIGMCGPTGGGKSPESACKSILDTEFEIEADMVDAMIEMSVNELVAQFASMPEDKDNNSADVVIQQRSRR